MIGSAADAEDLAQDTFVKAYQSLGSFRGSATLSTWLFRIATNVCIDYRRRRKHAPARALPLEVLGSDTVGIGFTAELPDSAPGPESCVLRMELQRKVRDSIDRLPEKLRAVLVLFDIEGLSYEEIAQVLGCPLGTVKSRLFSARQGLRQALAGYVDDLALGVAAAGAGSDRKVRP